MTEREIRIAPADLSSAAVAAFRVDPAYALTGHNQWFISTAKDRFALFSPGQARIDEVDAVSGEVVSSVALQAADEYGLHALFGTFGDRHIAAAALRYSEGGGYAEDVALIDRETGEISDFIRDASDPHLINGTSIVFARGESILVSPFDLDSMRPTGDLRVIEEACSRPFPWGHTAFSMSETGDLLHEQGGTRGTDRHIVIYEPDGAARLFEEEGRSFHDELDISPDGTRLAIATVSAGGTFEVWGSEVDRPRLRRIIGGERADFSAPVFTPDGEHLLVTRRTTGDDGIELLLVDFDGRRPPRSVLSGVSSQIWTKVDSVSPDSQWAWLRWYESGAATPARLRLDGSGAIDFPLGREPRWNVQESPDGTGLLCFSSTQSGRYELYVCKLREDGVTPPVPVVSTRLWGFSWRMLEDGARAIRCVPPGGGRFFDVPISIEDAERGAERIVIGDTIMTDRTVDAQSLNGAIAFTGRELELHRGASESPLTEMSLTLDWTELAIRRR